MAMDWCRNCGELFHHDHPADDTCSPDCKQKLHLRLLGRTQETRDRPAARKTTPPPTMPIAAAWRLLSERAADLPDVLASEVFPLERRKHSRPT
jgi:hypothetical protein